MKDQVGFNQSKPDHHYRAEIPNCVDDAELDCYEYRVYGHIKRIACDDGICFKSVKNIALHCKVSERKVIEILSNLCSINQILGLPLLKKTIRKKENGSFDTCIYEIIDVWHLNKHLYSKEKIGSAHNAPGVVQDMHHPGAPGAYKEEPIKKNPIKKEEDEEKKSSSSIKINKTKRCFEGITDEMFLIWKDTFPSLDIFSQLKQCFAKAYNLKHRDDWLGYILNWLQTSEKQTKQNPTKSENICEIMQKNKENLSQFVRDCKNTEWTFMMLDDRLEFVKTGTKRYRVILFDAVDFSDRFKELTKLIGK